MTELPVVPNVLKVRFNHTYGTEVNTGWSLHMQYTNAPTQAQLDGLCTASGNSWNSHLAPSHNPAVTLTSVEGIDLADKAGVVSSVAMSHAGTLGGAQLSANAAMLVNFAVKRRYRGGKPRIYVPAGSTASLATPQTWNAAFLTAFQSGFSALMTDMANNAQPWAGSVFFCMVSYYLGATWHGPDGGPYKRVPTKRAVPHVDPVTGVLYSSIVGSQRGRLRQG